VGNITGGTAACAWTVARCFPDAEHTVVFLSRPNQETRLAFDAYEVRYWTRVTVEKVRDSGADLLILHNTSAGRVESSMPVLTVCYQHSRIVPATSDLTLYCSKWLAKQSGGDPAAVLYQPVSVPHRQIDEGDTRALREHPVVGRLCTPTGRKWPEATIEFYRALAKRHPHVEWEFVGCPENMQSRLAAACGGNARFFDPSWDARNRLWQWDALLYHHPTLTESFGRTAAEAMRAGCIPILDNRGGFTEQMPTDGGFLCGTEEDFGNALERVSDPGERRRMSRACRAHADALFSLANFRDTFLERLDAMLGI